MWLKKKEKKTLTKSLALYSEEMRMGYGVQSSENHVKLNKSVYTSHTSELASHFNFSQFKTSEEREALGLMFNYIT